MTTLTQTAVDDSQGAPTATAVKPNTFIIGAPKSGTTALAHYLSEHPAVFMCGPKEPFYWNSDHEGVRDVHGVHTEADYLRLFRGADPTRHAVIAEGTTQYLQSRVAVPDVLAFNPDAKFVVMLRNPVEASHAMHGELIHHFAEDEPDFERAWELQDERAAGRRLPENCAFPHQLRYREVSSYALQLERFFAVTRPDNRYVIVYDDFRADTAGVYRGLLEWLGLSDDGRTEFPRVNPSRGYRLGWVGKLYQTPPAPIAPVMRRFRTWYQSHGGRVRQAIASVALEKRQRSELRPEFVERLKNEFRDDVHRTGELIGRDLSHWVAPAD